MDAATMSLDEIISKKKIRVNAGRPLRKSTNNDSTVAERRRRPESNNGINRSQQHGHHREEPSTNLMIDARNKIIQKNRSKIRDARDKLLQKSINKRVGGNVIRDANDARLRIMRKMPKQSIQSRSAANLMHSKRPASRLQRTEPQYSARPIKENMKRSIGSGTRSSNGRIGGRGTNLQRMRNNKLNPMLLLNNMMVIDDEEYGDLYRGGDGNVVDDDDDDDVDDDYVGGDDDDVHNYDDIIINRPQNYVQTSNPLLRRTVKNDMMYPSMMVARRRASITLPPPLPDFSRDRRHLAEPTMPLIERSTASSMSNAEANWNSDPFDCYEIPVGRPADVSEPKHLSMRYTDDILPPPPRRGILRTSSRDVYRHQSPSPPPPPPPPQQQHHRQERRYSPDDQSQLSYEMRVRLERSPDTSSSRGIFANPYNNGQQQRQHSAPISQQQQQQQQRYNREREIHISQQPSQRHQQASQVKQVHRQESPPLNTIRKTEQHLGGYRIVVSNLHSSVSESDIKELFEDIGELMEAKMVRPGVAVVIFSTMKDAETAVDTYHNRQLDGQPMKCLLVNPRSSGKPTAPALTTTRSGVTSNKSSMGGGGGGGGRQSSLEIDMDALHTVLFRKK